MNWSVGWNHLKDCISVRCVTTLYSDWENDEWHFQYMFGHSSHPLSWKAILLLSIVDLGLSGSLQSLQLQLSSFLGILRPTLSPRGKNVWKTKQLQTSTYNPNLENHLPSQGSKISSSFHGFIFYILWNSCHERVADSCPVAGPNWRASHSESRQHLASKRVPWLLQLRGLNHGESFPGFGGNLTVVLGQYPLVI